MTRVAVKVLKSDDGVTPSSEVRLDASICGSTFNIHCYSL